jgi:hypothetical protein
MVEASSRTIDLTLRPADAPASSRLFVILTRAEADAVVTLGVHQRRTPAALRALAKIQTALKASR